MHSGTYTSCTNRRTQLASKTVEPTADDEFSRGLGRKLETLRINGRPQDVVLKSILIPNQETPVLCSKVFYNLKTKIMMSMLQMVLRMVTDPHLYVICALTFTQLRGIRGSVKISRSLRLETLYLKN